MVTAPFSNKHFSYRNLLTLLKPLRLLSPMDPWFTLTNESWKITTLSFFYMRA